MCVCFVLLADRTAFYEFSDVPASLGSSVAMVVFQT